MGLSHWAGLGLAVAILSSPGAAYAQRSPYVGEEKRAIKALSPSAIEGLLNGEGMGLARAAELNRYPGPKHVLELRDELKLTPTQETKTQREFDKMLAEAKALGKKIVLAEAKLEAAFSGGSATDFQIENLTDSIARLQGKLRLCHLKAHLRMVEIMSKWQVSEYNRLRGYSS